MFGKNTAFSAQVSLGALTGTDGFSIPGLGAQDDLGTSVSGLGDVNGDGIADIIVGASGKSVPQPGSLTGARDTVGEAYVIFGSTTAFGATFDLATLSGTNGFAITTASVGDQLGFTTDGAGDINNDGIRDIVVGATQSSNAGGDDSGEVYVVFGRNAARP